MKICPDCGEKLIGQLPEEEKQEFGKEVELALLHSTSNMIYVDFLEQALKDNGINCLLKREAPSIYGSGTVASPFFETKIYVPKDKLEEARKIKEQTIDNL
jgi:hypothetical protein